MSRITSLLILVFAVFSFSFAVAKPVQRKVNEDKIELLKSNADFQYEVGYKTAENPLDRIWQWLIMKILRLLSYGTSSPFGSIIFYGIIAAILVYAIIKIFNIQVLSSIYGSRKSKNLVGEIHDDISQINFEESINKAFGANDYREVVRLYYLRSLQHLDEISQIKWEKGKTNLDYLYEIKHPETKSTLSDLNYYFEYAVYGDFPITEKLAQDSKRLYHVINEALR